MSDTAPSIYLLHGEDELAISETIAKIRAKLGDPAMAEMNTTYLDGHSLSLDELVNATSAMPFLAPRRLVVLTRPTARLNSPAERDRFKQLLNKVPPSTALVLVSHRSLTDERFRKRGKLNWLEEWAVSAGERVFVKRYPLPTGGGMVRWIQDRAQAAGGQFTSQAAAVLADLVGDAPRMADQEINKLLAYVDYARPVEADDVENLTPSAAKVKDFALVNALRNQDGRQALTILRQKLAEEDPIPIFHSVVYQFRQLLLAREVLDSGGGEAEVARSLGMHPYAAKLAAGHARHFTLGSLEAIYRRLLELDKAIKTGQMSGELALHTLIVRLTHQPASRSY